MAEKCSICNRKINYTFLSKIMGTYVKKGKKLYPICNQCQRQHPNLSHEQWLKLLSKK